MKINAYGVVVHVNVYCTYYVVMTRSVNIPPPPPPMQLYNLCVRSPSTPFHLEDVVISLADKSNSQINRWFENEKKLFEG